MRSVDFGLFLVELIRTNDSIRYNLGKTLFIFDSAKTHSVAILKEIYSKIHYLLIPPQSSDLNPIELLFRSVKSKLRI